MNTADINEESPTDIKLKYVDILKTANYNKAVGNYPLKIYEAENLINYYVNKLKRCIDKLIKR